MLNKEDKILSLPLSTKIRLYNKTIDNLVKTQNFLPENARKIYFMKNIEHFEAGMGGFVAFYEHIIHDDFDTEEKYLLVEPDSLLVTSGKEEDIEYIIKKGILYVVNYCEKEIPDILF